MTVEPKPAIAKQGKATVSGTDIAAAAADSIRAMMLIRTYRVRGHLAANLDPLGLSQRELPADLTPEYHGFTGDDLDKPVYLGGTLGLETATVRALVDRSEEPTSELLFPTQLLSPSPQSRARPRGPERIARRPRLTASGR